MIDPREGGRLDWDSIRRLPGDTRIFVTGGLKYLMKKPGKRDVVELDWR